MSSEPMAPLLQRPDWFEAFTKQELEGKWKPIPNFEWTIGFFLALTVIMLPLGGGVFYSAKQNLNYSERQTRGALEWSQVLCRYDEGPDKSMNEDNLPAEFTAGLQRFNVTIQVRDKMESPVYVYYELKDFYQNHKRYVRSAEYDQIGKGDISSSQLSVCDPYKLIPENESLPEDQRKSTDDRIINPCGLVAHSYFNDTFTLNSSFASNGVALTLVMKETGISTEWDRKYLYGEHSAQNFNDDPDTRGGSGIEGALNEDEHFMVWMKVGSRPTVRKLYGIIEEDIPKGANLTFEIHNRYNTYKFGGEKRLILSTTNWTGGRDIFTGILFFVIGGMSAMACLVILLLDRRINREPGDIQSLSWLKKNT